jgi:hypothetical protein
MYSKPLSIALILLTFFQLSNPLLHDDPPLSESDQSPNRLFYIARSKNTNVVCYDVQYKKPGQINPSDPIKVYWINRTDDPGKRDGLSFIQRKFAYGYDFDKTAENTFQVHLVAFKERPLTLTMDNNKAVCRIPINKKPAILHKIFIQSDPSSFTKVEYAELEGVDVQTGKSVSERVYPD